MTARAAAALICVPVLFLTPGCITLIEEQAEQNRVQNTEIHSQRVEMEQLRSRIEWLEKSEADLLAQLAAMRSEIETIRRELSEKTAAAERSIQALDAARQADKDEITNRLAARMSELLNAQTQAASQQTRQGREHVVKAGETLSTIAAAYKVRVNAIAEANNISNPNSIRPGQKLLIPE